MSGEQTMSTGGAAGGMGIGIGMGAGLIAVHPPTTPHIPAVVKALYFNYKDDDKTVAATCKLCFKTFRDKKGTTSNFHKHYKSCHSTSPTYIMYLQQHIKGYDSLARSSSWVDQYSSPSMVPVAPVAMRGHPVIPTAINTSHHYQQQGPGSHLPPQAANNAERFQENHPRQLKVNDIIMKNLIVGCSLPISILNKPLFRMFVRFLEPKWTPMDHGVALNRVPEIVKRVENRIRTLVDECRYMFLTIESWTDLKITNRFIALTARGITEHFDLIVCTLSCDIQKAPLTLLSKNIFLAYNQAMWRYNITKNKVMCNVIEHDYYTSKPPTLALPGFEAQVMKTEEETEQGAGEAVQTGISDDDDDSSSQQQWADSFQTVQQIFNVGIVPKMEEDDPDINCEAPRNMFEGSELKSIPCFTHTLNLVVQDGLKVTMNFLPDCLMKVRKLADVLQSNSFLSEAFCTLFSIKIPRFDVEQHWNDQLKVLKSITSKCDFIQMNELLVAHDKPILFTKYDSSVLKEFIMVMEPFEEAADLCQGNYLKIMCSIVAPCVVALLKHLDTSSAELSFLNDFGFHLKLSLKQHFKTLFDQLIQLSRSEIDQKIAHSFEGFGRTDFLIAPVLDPQFKFMWIDEDIGFIEEQGKKILKLKLRDIIKDMAISLSHSRTNPTNLASPAGPESFTGASVVRNTTQGVKRKTLFSYTTVTNTSPEIDIELSTIIEMERYLKMPFNSNQSCLGFWKENRVFFPHLSSVSRKLLCIPATPSPVEKIMLDDDYRIENCSDTNQQRNLTFLKCNLDLIQ